MSGRPTADLVAELTKNANWYDAGDDWLLDAARRLAELDGAYERGIEDAWKLIDALRPPCSTCGGKMKVPTYADGGFPITMTERPCPDCVDGKASIEQLAATWRTVWDDWSWSNVLVGPSGADAINGCRDHLRAVKP